MKRFDSPQSEAAMQRLVLARLVAGVITVFAVVLAPQVSDSIATLPSSKVLEAQANDDSEPLPENGVEVRQTAAAAMEPLTTSY